VSITGTAAETATLTISTTASTSASLYNRKGQGVPWYAVGGTALVCALLFGVPGRRRNWRTILGMLAFLIVITGGVLACGGGGGGGGGGTGNPGTTPGSYTVTITGTSGTTTTTGAVTLTVQ
jgi:trimeric autotransporter adhesin